MLISGSATVWLAAWVAARRASTSCGPCGITATLATSAPRRSASANLAVSHATSGVAWKLWYEATSGRPFACAAAADAPEVRRVAGHLPVDHVDAARVADGLMHADDVGLGHRDRLAAFTRRAAREQHRRRAGGGTDGTRGVDDDLGVAELGEEVDSPLEQVGCLWQHRHDFGEDFVARAADQRRADQGQLAAGDRLAAEVDQSGGGHGGSLRDRCGRAGAARRVRTSLRRANGGAYRVR